VVFGIVPQKGMNPTSLNGWNGPRGLIRVGFYTDQKGPPKLLNYIAIEPVVRGIGFRFDRMAFSELEMSTLDPGLRGKRMWVHEQAGEKKETLRGKLETLHAGRAEVERLTVRIDVERFTQNGAHVYLLASVESDRPSELRLEVFAEEDRPDLEELTVTATMGNFERLRWLWLNGRVEQSLDLFSSYNGDAFTEGENYPLSEMLRTGEGDAIVFCTTNEHDPSTTPGARAAHWVYTLPKMTQYWRVPGYDVQPDLRVRVNARRVYWASHEPVFGGIVFENFEVRERYRPGQSFIFGISPREPWELYRGSSHLAAPPQASDESFRNER
jgi:hypothetical protein